MNEYIFYSCEGFTYPPKEGSIVDNCQVLGLALGQNAKEAQDNLLNENPWIVECGFDIDEATCKQLVNDEISEILSRNREEIEYLVNLLDKRQLDKFDEWLIKRKKYA